MINNLKQAPNQKIWSQMKRKKEGVCVCVGGVGGGGFIYAYMQTLEHTYTCI